MRRLLAALLLALGGLAVPAAASHGEIVLVADGPSSGVLDLPASARLDLSGLEIETRSPYAVVAFAQGGAVVNYMLRLRDMSEFRYVSTNRLPAGRSLVRVVTQGRTTLTLPVLNMHGRRTVRLRRGLPGAVGVLRRTQPDANNDVTDDIPFTMHGNALVVHAVSRRHRQEVVTTDSTCVEVGDAPCGAPPDVRVLEGSRGSFSMGVWNARGQAHAYHRSTAVGTEPEALRHGLVVVPVE